MNTNQAAGAAAGATAQTPLLRNRFFQTILMSNIMLQIGIWVRNFAILLYVTDQTNNDPIAVSLISVAEFSPIFLFAFIGGTFADRWLPKRTMIWCDLMSAASVVLVLVALVYESWAAVYFATFLSATLSQFSAPSSMKLFKQHVPQEQLQSAMGIFQTLMAVFLIAGPSVGTIVYQNFGIHVSIGVMGVASFLSALILFRLPQDKAITRRDPEAKPTSVMTEMKEGLRYVWGSRVLRTMCITFALAGLSGGIAQTLGLFVVTERLGQPKEFLQYVLMISGIGMLIGGAFITVVSKKMSPVKMLALALGVSAVGTVGVGYSMNVPFTLSLQLIMGMIFPMVHISINTIMLKWSAPEFIGRVSGTLGPMYMGAMVLMMALAGPLKTILPLTTIYTLSGLLMLAGVLSLVPLFKRQAPEPAATSISA
ncbi:MFS transporter [Paenibacillus lignilyticus]|uniref:MFS transporter n=1 Tax=Paenibacillus lignilyticus TaxID=1172615 RepID=A0ABS5C9E4_9BACL|nr:MFS transporter [Paenibacillus lignilyticus]MBP3962624.1 MFS transporter [Paenibacillus lignilyticus]